MLSEDYSIICTERNIPTFTNYLSPEKLRDFINAIPKFKGFHGGHGQPPPINYRELQLFFKILYYCALRISECVNLKKSDFDLDHRILRVRSPKTKKMGFQKTTIPPPIIDDLDFFLDYHYFGEQLFKIHRYTAWSYAKQIGKIAGFNFFDEMDTKSIEGLYPHAFRKGYAKFMEEARAKPSLIMLKCRWKTREMFQVYTKPSFYDLMKWEHDVFFQKYSYYRTIFK